MPAQTLRVPFVPSSWDAVKTIIELADVKPTDIAADLGSGDGRIVIGLAQKGAEAHGYEIDLDLVIQAESNILEQKLDGKTFIHCRNYWEENLSFYNIITIYGMNSIMKDLEKKLKKELKPGSKVISNIFTFPSWKPEKTIDTIHRYIVP